MEWGTPVKWGKFLLFCVPQSVKTKETNPTRPGSPTPCKQAPKFYYEPIKLLNDLLTSPETGFVRHFEFPV